MNLARPLAGAALLAACHAFAATEPIEKIVVTGSFVTPIAQAGATAAIPASEKIVVTGSFVAPIAQAGAAAAIPASEKIVVTGSDRRFPMPEGVEPHATPKR